MHRYVQKSIVQPFQNRFRKEGFLRVVVVVVVAVGGGADVAEVCLGHRLWG